MKKVLIAGLVAFALVALAGSVSAWYVDIYAQVDNATGIIYGAGGSDECGECLICDECYGDGCAATCEYYLQGTAGIVDGYGNAEVEGFGTNGWGIMGTWIMGEAYEVFAGQELDALVCQDCCDPFEWYGASSSVDVEMGYLEAELLQGTEEVGPYTGYWPTAGQILHAYGGGAEIGVDMTASEGDETHTMGIYGTDVGFSAFSYQGFEYGDSTMYGAFWPTEDNWYWGDTPLMWYGDFWGYWD